MNALEITNLNKTYSSKRGVIKAVDNLSLTVAHGEMFALLGTNGAGKSTTIKICTGLTTPDSGKAVIYGIDISAEPVKAKECLNVSPQETAVAPNLTVLENLEFIAEIYGKSGKDAHDCAETMMHRLGLSDRAGDKAGKLSGGFKRRLSIAMALISEPKLLFLDEPTLGLDVLARRELWHFIKMLKGKMTIVLTTHYLEEAEALCDRIAIMHQGVVQVCGTASEIIAEMGTDNFEDAFLKIAGAEEFRYE